MEDNIGEAQATVLETCVSCGAKLKGDYCRKCGEKKIVPERDFNIHKFLNQTLWHFIHFDSKLLKSCWLLFSKPGFLTAEWIIGRRVGYMKPFQLFLVANVLFYFFLPTVTAHFTDPRELTQGYTEQIWMLNVFHFDFGKALTELADRLQETEETLSDQIIVKAAHRSKTGLFFIIPFWGSLIYLFFRRKNPWLVPHLMFAMHGLTFYLLWDLTIHAILGILGIKTFGGNIFLFLMLTFPMYQILATYRVYKDFWPLTILKTVGIATGFWIFILLYRQIITISTVVFP